MQSVSSRIWTRVAVSTSHDDNHYTITYYSLPIDLVFNDRILLEFVERKLSDIRPWQSSF